MHTTLPLLSPSALADTDATRRFASGDPFRHVLIESFFEPAFLSQLLAEFPPFERGNARNEAGGLGGKSVVERIRTLGPAFAALDDLVQSPTFLGWLSGVTGIPDLHYDPHYFGGGTHDNRHGQELDPHIDFNHHPVTNEHRRLNLILYLNEGWDPAWGGNLELHSDPRAPDDRIVEIAPLQNRCVIFETTESSWHGFSKIQLPEAERSRSRRSIALYFYTASRPADEAGDPHSTVYVDRPLPVHLKAGHTLSVEDENELAIAIARRDQHIQRLYGDVQRLMTENEQAKAALGRSRLARLAHFARRGLAALRR